jgi:hypothetical protein
VAHDAGVLQRGLDLPRREARDLLEVELAKARRKFSRFLRIVSQES